jgi:hypothetical protein
MAGREMNWKQFGSRWAWPSQEFARRDCGKTHKKNVRIADALPEIQTNRPQNMRLEDYHYASLFGKAVVFMSSCHAFPDWSMFEV